MVVTPHLCSVPTRLSRIRFNASERWTRVNIRWCEHPEGQEGAANEGAGRWIWPNQYFTSTSADWWTQRGRVRVCQGPCGKVIRSPPGVSEWRDTSRSSAWAGNQRTAWLTCLVLHPQGFIAIHPTMFLSLIFLSQKELYILNHIGKWTTFIQLFPAPSCYPKALSNFLSCTYSLTHQGVAAAMYGAASPVGSNSGLSVLPKDTTAEWYGVGFEPLSFRSLGNLLFRLSYSCSYFETHGLSSSF